MDCDSKRRPLPLCNVSHGRAVFPHGILLFSSFLFGRRNDLCFLPFGSFVCRLWPSLGPFRPGTSSSRGLSKQTSSTAQVPFLQPPNPSPSPASFREGSPLISMTTVAPCQLVCAVCKCLCFLCPSKSACRLPVADSSLFKETVLTVPSWV